MKVIIAGSRGIWSIPWVEDTIKASGFEVTEVVSGGCRGVDEIGEAYAQSEGIPCRVFPADWKANGRAAGPIRNAEMAAYADALIAVWDGKSRGTKNMIDEAKKRGLKVYIHRVNP
jgi:hypothetical protein